MFDARRTVKGAVWSAVERLSVQGVQFAILVLMARLLTPTDYGLVGMLAIFITIGQLLADGGFSQAIIRLGRHTEEDVSTAFFFNIGVGALLYILLFFSAPLIADFYGEPRLTDLARVLSLSVLINSTLVVHRAILTSRIDFKTQAKTTLAGALCSGVVGVWMAYSGFGVWAIAGLQLTNHAVTGAALWILSPWRPRMRFAVDSFRRLFGFGSRIMASDILDTFYSNIYMMTIGKVFSAYSLGCYTRADQLGDFASVNVTRIIKRATFPALCSLRDEPERLAGAFCRHIRYYAFIVFPLMVGLSAIAVPFVELLFGSQWLYAARLLRILALAMMLFPLISVNMMVLEVMGDSRRYLRLQLAAKGVGLLSLAALIPFGLSAVCCGLVVTAVVGLVIAIIGGGRRIGLGLRTQFKAVLPSLLFSAAMYGAIVGLLWILPTDDNAVRVLLGVIAGILVYFGLALAFRSRDLRDLVSLVLK
ncbi:MAG: lipopolysaccharide biosynthesis protein [[Clostridium] fimetarium]|nr:lipopolysaccharide biosynthesis protein [Alistipes timonensis]MCM1404805.1 lipopolysaccharide biosynthesis protein [[Clostridium] fimetarium]